MKKCFIFFFSVYAIIRFFRNLLVQHILFLVFLVTDKGETAIDLARDQSNQIISNLSKNLIECFKEQNKIMERSLTNITGILKRCVLKS